SFRDVGIEVVHEHPQRRFLVPSLAGSVRPTRGAHRLAGRSAWECALWDLGLGFRHRFRHILSPAGGGIKTLRFPRGPRGPRTRSTHPIDRDRGPAFDPRRGVARAHGAAPAPAPAARSTEAVSRDGFTAPRTAFPRPRHGARFARESGL